MTLTPVFQSSARASIFNVTPTFNPLVPLHIARPITRAGNSNPGRKLVNGALRLWADHSR